MALSVGRALGKDQGLLARPLGGRQSPRLAPWIELLLVSRQAIASRPVDIASSSGVSLAIRMTPPAQAATIAKPPDLLRAARSSKPPRTGS